MENNFPNTTQEHSSDAKQWTSSASFISLSDIIFILKSNWYWYIIALLFTIGGAYFYLKKTPNIYEREAAILVKTQPDAGASLSDFLEQGGMQGISGAKGEIENEILILKTNVVLEEAIQRLHLDVEYVRKEGLQERSLYLKTPITVSFINENPEETVSFKAEYIGEDSVRLSHFWSSIQEFADQTIIAPFAKTVLTPIGEVVVEPGAAFPSYSFIGEVKVTKLSQESVLGKYMSNYSVGLMGKSASVIKLVIKDNNPAIATDFLNTLVAVYSENIRNDKIRTANHTEAFIDERLTIISRELGSVDSQIEHFKQEHSIADISTETRSIVEGSAVLTNQINEVNNKIAVAHFLKDHLTSSQNRDHIIPANAGLIDDASNTIINEYNGMLLKREQLLRSSSDKNPVVQTLNNQIAATRQAILKSIDNQVEALNIRKATLEGQVNITKGRISSVPMQEKIVGSIYRDQKIKEELYLFLLNARERNALSKESVDSNIRLVQPATGSSRPVAPRRIFIMGVAFLLALLLPSALLYLRFISNNKVRGSKDLNMYTTVPLLAEIPHYRGFRSEGWAARRGKKGLHKRRTSRRNNVFIVRNDSRSMISEAFAVLRANISFMSREGIPPKVLMVTSAIASSGKTFVSSNLAVSLAMLDNKRILVLDGDLRKGSLTDALQGAFNKHSLGLSAYLSNKDLSIEDIVITVGDEKNTFDFIPAGAFPPNPAELLLSMRFQQLVEMLREQYDYILIDSVPFLNLADARITGRVADTTLVVVREAFLPRVLLAEVERYHQDQWLPDMTIVLNDAGRGGSTTGYHYSSYGNYGYGYGYEGYNKEQDPKA